MVRVEMVMSYEVTFKAKHSQPWFHHAWDHVMTDRMEMINTTILSWNKVYDSVITLEKPDSYVWTITFPSEQDYVMFLLRWS